MVGLAPHENQSALSSTLEPLTVALVPGALLAGVSIGVRETP